MPMFDKSMLPEGMEVKPGDRVSFTVKSLSPEGQVELDYATAENEGPAVEPEVSPKPEERDALMAEPTDQLRKKFKVKPDEE